LDEGGLFITRLGTEGVLEKAGLRVGDVLTAIDGKPLNSVLDLPRLIQRLDSESTTRRIEVELTRHGVPEHLTYDLDE
jgi:S1-C subfamily serine protease